MSSPGTLRFGQVATKPSAPPVGYDLIYVKTDDVLYIQDSFGVEVALGSASAITSLTGEVTATGPGAAAATVSNSAVIGKVLTGFSPGPNSAVLATDTILQAFQKLQAQVSGATGTAITALTGDVSATGPGSVSATVNSIGGSSATNVHSAELAANAATPSNVVSTIVKRDASGNFAAGTITANLTGNVSGSSSSFTGSLAGDVTGTQSSTVVATVGGSSAANIHSAELAANAATSSNTASTIVERDASGNFSAGTITANLTGTATNATNATTAINFSGSLSGDVTGTQSATAISSPTVTGKLLTGYSIGANSPISATDSILLAFEKTQGQLNATSSSAITALTGDVSATGPGSVPATVNSVGGSSAANVHSAELAANAATSTNTASTIVKRDASGNFSAGTITANLTGNVSGSAASFTGSLSGDVTGTQSATVVSTVGGSSAANIHSAELAANAATSSNTPSTIVQRDASGNFSAGTITANITGNVSGSSSTFTGSLSGDVMGTESATVISSSTVTSKLLTGYVVGTNTPIAATDSILLAFEKTQGQLNATTGAAITALTGDVVATGPGSVTATIQTNTVSNSKLAQMPANTLKGNNTGSTANAADLTIPQVVTMFGGTPVTQTPDQANSAGTSNTFSRADHIHNIPSGVPVQIGTTNIQGSATTFSLADHVHNHGNQTVGTLHAAVTTTVNGFMSAADKVKLNTISSAPGTNTQILISDGTNLNPQTVSGDATITNTGVVSVNSVTGTIPVNKGGTGATTAPAARVNLNIDERSTFSNAAYTVLSTDRYVAQIGTMSAPRVVTLPAANSLNAGQQLTITDESGTVTTTNTLTITAVGADTINGSASKTIRTGFGYIILYSNGSNEWFAGIEAIGRGGTGTGTLPTDGQLLIGQSSTSSYVVSTLTQAANQGVTINNGSGSITLGTAQDIRTTASPTFANITDSALSANGAMYASTSGLLASTAAMTNGQLLVGSTGSAPVATTLTQGANNGVTIANAAGSITLSTAQDIRTSASPTFANLTDSGLSANGAMYASTSGLLASTAALTNGQLLVGSTGSTPVATALTAGTGISITNAAGSITIASSGSTAQVTKTANYTILTSDSTIFTDSSGGAFTLTLPSPTTIAGKIFRIIDTTGSMNANNITLARSASEKIEGLAASKVLQTNWGWFQVTTNGTDWFVG